MPTHALNAANPSSFPRKRESRVQQTTLKIVKRALKAAGALIPQLLFWAAILCAFQCAPIAAQTLPSQWLPASPLSLQDGRAAPRQADIAAEGAYAAAVWSAEPLGVRTLFWRESGDRGETWTPVTLLFPPDAERTEPTAAHDGSSLWVAWTQRDPDGGTDIWTARRTENGWANPTRATASGSASRPRLAVTRSSPRRAALAYEDRSGAFPRAMLAESENGGADWSAPRPLGDPAAPSAQPDIAAANGIFHLVWQDFQTAQPHLYYAARGRGFAPPIRRLSQTPGVRSPFIDARDGKLLAAWERHAGVGGPDIYAALGDSNAREWTPPAALTSGVSQSARPTGAVREEGSVVVWQDGRSGRFDLYAAQTQPDGSWEAPFALVESSAPSTQPRMSAGQAQLVWMENGAVLHSARDAVPPDQPSQPVHFDLSANAGWDDDGTLLFRWEETPDAHAYRADVTINGAEIQTFMLDAPTLTLTLPAGTAVVTATAIDAVGNAGAPSIPSAPVRVDATPPTARIYRPVNGERLFTDYAALFSCVDANLKSCVVEIGEGENPSEWTPLAGPFIESFEEPKSAPFQLNRRGGVITLRVRAEDAAGNRSEAVARAVVDLEEPPMGRIERHSPLRDEPTLAAGRRGADWSDAAQRLAYISDESGAADLWTARLDGSDASPAAADAFLDASPSWHPNGKWIAYASLRGGAWQIAARDWRTGEERPLVMSAYDDREPSWSPDGSALAFVSGRSGRDEIYLLENAEEALNGADALIRRADRSGVPGRRPSWHPNGTKLAYESLQGGAPHIWTLDLYEGAPRPLIQIADSRAPVYSAAGKRVMFTRFINGSPSLWVWSALSGSVHRLTPLGLEAQYGVWTAGESAAFETGGDLAVAPLLAPAPDLEARIESPRSGSVVSGQVKIAGSARGVHFDSYDLTYAPADDSAAPISITGVASSPVERGGFLGLWNAEGLSGEFILRLMVNGADGQPAASAQSRVSILAPSAELDIWEPGNGMQTLEKEIRLRGRARGLLSVNGERLPLNKEGYFDAVYPLLPGENLLKFVLQDHAGRTTLDERVVRRVSSPFEIQLDAPSNFEMLETPYVRVSGRAAEARTVWINGETAALGENGAFERWTSVPSEGGYIEARAVDALGREASVRRWVAVRSDSASALVDSSPPALVDPSPPFNAVLSDSRPTFQARILDNRPLEGFGISVFLDGEEIEEGGWQLDAQTGAFRFEPPTALQDGAHLLLIKGADAAGNALINGQWRVTIDSVPLLARLSLFPSSADEFTAVLLTSNRPLERIERAQLRLNGQTIGAPFQLNRIEEAAQWQALEPFFERGSAEFAYAAVLNARLAGGGIALVETRGKDGKTALLSGEYVRGALSVNETLSLNLKNGVRADFFPAETGGEAVVRSADGLDADLAASQWRGAAERGLSPDALGAFTYSVETTAPEAQFRLSAPLDADMPRAWMLWDRIRRRWRPMPDVMTIQPGENAEAALLGDAHPPYLTRVDLPSAEASRFYVEAEFADDGVGIDAPRTTARLNGLPAQASVLSGENAARVRFIPSNLRRGLHTLTLNVYDRAGNRASESFEFFTEGGFGFAAFQLAPNPASNGEGRVLFQLTQRADVTMEIYAIDGSLVYRDDLSDVTGDEFAQKDCRECFTWNFVNNEGRAVAPGVYIVQLTARSKSGQTARATAKWAALR